MNEKWEQGFRSRKRRTLPKKAATVLAELRLFDDEAQVGRDCQICSGKGQRKDATCTNCEGTGRAIIPY